MLPGLRSLKRFLLAFIALGIILGAFVFGTRYFSDPVPTPTPDPRDQLAAIEIISTDLLRVKAGDYDVVARVRNPNTSYGSGDVRYVLRLDGGQEHRGSFYILPGQTKYIVISPLHVEVDVASAKLAIESIKWHQLDTLALSGVNFVVTNASYLSNQSGIFGRLRGFVANNSDFDVQRADVAVMLFDKNDKILAVNRTEIHTFLAHSTRGFEATWFTAFTGTVARTYVEAHTNLFQQSSFIRTYGGAEQFQAY